MPIIGSFIVPLLVALITAIITSLIALKNFRRERMWDLKVKTYEAVFDALFDFSEFFRKQVRLEVLNDIEEDELDAEKESYDRAEYFLGRILFKGEFIIHPDAVKELDRLSRNLQDQGPNFWANLLTGDKRYKFYQRQKNRVVESTDRLRRIAKKDLS